MLLNTNNGLKLEVLVCEQNYTRGGKKHALTFKSAMQMVLSGHHQKCLADLG